MKKMKMKLLLIMLLTYIGISAQIKVSGVVYEQSNNLPLPGVNVILKGTTKGTTSDFDGKYEITANKGDILVFSYIGFQNQEIVVSTATLDINLVESPNKLDEVVIIGYGTTTVKDATGAISKVTSKDFNGGAIASPEQLISGKTAGVNVIPPSGQPGQGATIRIRGGASSLNGSGGSTSPLIVVDGVAIDQNGPALNSVNPNDIESFVILKDASATAIYGSRASAGVILITTKSGKLNAPFKVEISSLVSVGKTANRAEVLSPEQYRAATIASGNDTAISLLGDANTNWQDQIYQQAYGSDNNITFSQGFKNSSYRVSIGYLDQSGVLKTSNFKRNTASINFKNYLFDRSLKIDLNIRGSLSKDHFANGGAIGNAVTFDPTQPIFSGSELYGGYWEWLQSNGDPSGLAPRNPLGLLKQNSNIADTRRVLGNIKLDYSIPYLEGLKANLNLGFDYADVEGDTETLATSAGGFNTVGNIGTYTSLRRSTTSDFYLNYVKDFESIKSNIDFTLGHSFQKFTRFNDSSNINGNGVVPNVTSARTHNSLVSYFGRLNYSYDSKYLLTFTYRRDGSSRFSPENRWGNFLSGAFAWNISEEAFLKDSETISSLKLRLGYGQTGQQEIGSDFGFLPVYQDSADNFSYTLGGQPFNTIRPNGYDVNIKWEESTTYNLGLDFGFINNRITGSLEYFFTETEDILNNVNPPAGANLTNTLFTNIGDLENSGIEFSLASDIIQQKDFNWNLGFNISYYENKIVKLSTVDDPDSQGQATGTIAGGIGNTVQTQKIGLPQNSFLVYKQVYDTDGTPLDGVYEDLNGDGVFTTEDKYIFNNPNADYIIGISSTMNYKKFDLNFTLRGSIGNYVYNNVASANGNQFGLHSLGSNRNVDTSFLNTEFNNVQLWSDYYVQDASFLKMDNITLGYNFNDLIANDNINLRMYTTVQNVFTITNYDGLDPEVNGGIDNNLFPRPRTFLLGLNINF